MNHSILACVGAAIAVICVASDSIWSTCVGSSGSVTTAAAVLIQFVVLLMALLGGKAGRWASLLLSVLAFGAFLLWARVAFMTAVSFGFSEHPGSMTTRVFLLSMMCSISSLIVFDSAFRLSRTDGVMAQGILPTMTDEERSTKKNQEANDLRRIQESQDE